MTKRVLVLIVFIAATTAFDASAACVGCLVQPCVTRSGDTVEAGMCDSQDVDYGDGISNCKNVSGCGGCMGWSCSRDGEVPLFAPVMGGTTVEAVPARDDADPDIPEN